MKYNNIKQGLTYSLLLLLTLAGNYSTAQCSSSFSYSQNTGGNITLTSTSTGTNSGTYYYWSYGDGDFTQGTALQQVSHTYAYNGSFTATLTIMTTSSCTSTFTQNVLVSTSPCSLALSASFSFTNLNGGQVDFTSTSINTTPGTSYLWNFGDGNSSTLANPTHTYSYNANFPVSLFISDTTMGNCSDSLWSNVTVTNVPCTLSAGFTWSNTSTAGQISFSSTSTGTTQITSYTWNFENSAWVFGNPAVYIFPANGVYTVALTVSDSQSCSATSTQTISVTSSPCNSLLTAGFTWTNTASGNVDFTSTSTGTTGATSYYWVFGDGATSSAPVTVSHIYTSNSPYLAQLVVTDMTNGFCQDSVNAVVYVSTAPCNINASFTHSLGFNGNVTFQSTSTGTTPTSDYVWDFGDGSPTLTSNNTLSAHSYTANGTYVATLTVHNFSPSCSGSLTQTITVSIVVCNLNSSFTYTSGSAGSASFTSISTGTNASTKHTWDFGDGTIQSSGTTPFITHNYLSNGSFIARLTIEDTLVQGCLDSSISWVTISNAPCLVNADFVVTQGTGGAVLFTNTSTNVWMNSWFYWNYGDGNTGNGSQSANTYTSAGVYTIQLIVADSSSTPCVSSITKTVNVILTPCNIDAGFTFATGTAGTVSFSSTNTFSNFGVEHFWLFGDGNYSTSVNPVHTYSVNNNYTVFHSISDTITYNCFDTLTQIVSVTNTLCLANGNFYLAKSTTTTGLWFAYPSYPGNVTAAIWSWGDGTNSTGLYPSHTYTAAGLYNICLSVTVSCGVSTTTCLFSNIYKMAGTMSMITINVVGPVNSVQDVSNEEIHFNVYPNPSDGEFRLVIEDNNTRTQVTEILVYDILGNIVFKEAIERNGHVENEIKLKDVASGVYFLTTRSGNKIYRKKLIIRLD